MSSANSFTPFPIWMLLISSLLTSLESPEVVRTEIVVLFLILGGSVQAFNSKYVSCSFFINALYQIEEVLFYSSFVECFCHEKVLVSYCFTKFWFPTVLHCVRAHTHTCIQFKLTLGLCHTKIINNLFLSKYIWDTVLCEENDYREWVVNHLKRSIPFHQRGHQLYNKVICP